jgi:uncharacterized protein (DUF305 family)
MIRTRAGQALAAALLSAVAATPGLAAPNDPVLVVTASPAPPSPASPHLSLTPSPEGAPALAPELGPEPRRSTAQDRDFANRMRRHYQFGLDAANRQIAIGRSPHMKALARRVVTAESQELADLEKWIALQKRAITADAPPPRQSIARADDRK